MSRKYVFYLRFIFNFEKIFSQEFHEVHKRPRSPLRTRSKSADPSKGNGIEQLTKVYFSS